VFLATQSGPMLLRHGQPARRFAPNSRRRNTRNGVGARSDGTVVFVLAADVTFYELAMAFRDRLQCTEALYLDGAVSRLYARGVTGPPSSGDAFAALIAVLATD